MGAVGLIYSVKLGNVYIQGDRNLIVKMVDINLDINILNILKVAKNVDNRVGKVYPLLQIGENIVPKRVVNNSHPSRVKVPV